MNRLRFACAAAALVLLFQIYVYAQAVNGTVVGTIKDESGAVVPDAQVTITETSTNVSRSVNTDANGYYSFPNLPPGNYDVKVAKQGFASAQQTAVPLNVNSTVRVDLQLRPGDGKRRKHVAVATNRYSENRRNSDVGTSGAVALGK